MAHNPSTWAHNKHILQDSAVDRAIAKAKTDLLYKKLLEEKRKEWTQKEQKDPDRPKVSSGANKEKEFSRIKQEREENDDYDSDLELEKEFENDPDLKKLHEARLEQLKENFKDKQVKMSVGHGVYGEMDEKEMLKTACKTESLVIHFYASGFDRCQILDEHFKRIAPKHVEARFVKINARKSPFVVNKWKIRTLPSICVVVNGYLVDKMIGFDDFGGKDDFPTLALVRRLSKSGAVKDVDGKVRKKVNRTQILTDL